MKLRDLRIEDIPARWIERMVMSIDFPWNGILDSGGYMVHPVPVPSLVPMEMISREREAISIQSLALLARGKAISGIMDIIGTNQFPNPPIKMGITTKKIITSACRVTIEL